jgi:hypothetical protein
MHAHIASHNALGLNEMRLAPAALDLASIRHRRLQCALRTLAAEFDGLH